MQRKDPRALRLGGKLACRQQLLVQRLDLFESRKEDEHRVSQRRLARRSLRMPSTSAATAGAIVAASFVFWLLSSAAAGVSTPGIRSIACARAGAIIYPLPAARGRRRGAEARLLLGPLREHVRPVQPPQQLQQRHDQIIIDHAEI